MLLFPRAAAFIHEMMRRCTAENVGLSRMASIGNKLMLDGSDILEFLLEDEGTSVIGVYLEDARNGRRLMDLASRTDKPIVI